MRDCAKVRGCRLIKGTYYERRVGGQMIQNRAEKGRGADNALSNGVNTAMTRRLASVCVCVLL